MGANGSQGEERETTGVRGTQSAVIVAESRSRYRSFKHSVETIARAFLKLRHHPILVAQSPAQHAKDSTRHIDTISHDFEQRILIQTEQVCMLDSRYRRRAWLRVQER